MHSDESLSVNPGWHLVRFTSNLIYLSLGNIVYYMETAVLPGFPFNCILFRTNGDNAELSFYFLLMALINLNGYSKVCINFLTQIITHCYSIAVNLCVCVCLEEMPVHLVYWSYNSCVIITVAIPLWQWHRTYTHTYTHMYTHTCTHTCAHTHTRFTFTGWLDN